MVVKCNNFQLHKQPGLFILWKYIINFVKILEVNEQALNGVKGIKFEKFTDNRGYFSESARVADLRKIAGLEDFEVIQANESYSKKNVIRGLHFQWNPKMGKLVRTVRGHMVDIVLDIRLGSETFGKVIFYDLAQSDEDAFGEWIWVPQGFAHGNFFLEDTVIEYYCTGSYNPECERGISVFSDGLDFSLANKDLLAKFEQVKGASPLISDKDKNGLSLSQWQSSPDAKEFSV